MIDASSGGCLGTATVPESSVRIEASKDFLPHRVDFVFVNTFTFSPRYIKKILISLSLAGNSRAEILTTGKKKLCRHKGTSS